MGGKIPRNIKIRVIRHWLDGLTREEITKREDIGAGTVTGIVQEARGQEECNYIDLLREVALKLKEEGLELPLIGYAIRLKRIMQENDIKEDQIEPIIQDFAAYSLRNSISFDTIIQIGREALYLEQKFGIPIERIPEIITQKKETIDRLEEQRLEILGQTQRAREDRDSKQQELDTISAKVEKYLKEIPPVQRIIELERELEETKKRNELHKISERELAKERDIAGLEAMRLKSVVIELDAKRKELARKLSLCIKELEKLGEKSTDNKSIVK
jgi:MFS superfamily sulfate permease-like transporter